MSSSATVVAYLKNQGGTISLEYVQVTPVDHQLVRAAHGHGRGQVQ